MFRNLLKGPFLPSIHLQQLIKAEILSSINIEILFFLITLFCGTLFFTWHIFTHCVATSRLSDLDQNLRMNLPHMLDNSEALMTPSTSGFRARLWPWPWTKNGTISDQGRPGLLLESQGLDKRCSFYFFTGITAMMLTVLRYLGSCRLHPLVGSRIVPAGWTNKSGCGVLHVFLWIKIVPFLSLWRQLLLKGSARKVGDLCLHPSQQYWIV